MVTKEDILAKRIEGMSHKKILSDIAKDFLGQKDRLADLAAKRVLEIRDRLRELEEKEADRLDMLRYMQEGDFKNDE